MQGVEVRFAEAALLDFNEASGLEFGNPRVHGFAGDVEVVGEGLLSRKAEVVVPCIAQEFRVNDDRAGREAGLLKGLPAVSSG